MFCLSKKIKSQNSCHQLLVSQPPTCKDELKETVITRKDFHIKVQQKSELFR